MTIYESLGGEMGIKRLVHRFYELMDELPEAYAVRQMHPESLEGSGQSLFEYLSGWFGRPSLYIQKNGHPPYYAVFPPVYYSSHITARPYGASPYAWPAGFSPIAYGMRGYAAQPAGPLQIDNPYVAGGAAPAAAAQAKSPLPLQIDNPHLASTIR